MFFTALGEAPAWAQILQGVYDLLPIILFLVGSIVLQQALYNKMVKGCYTLFAGGTIMVTSAGILKGLHKILLGFRVNYVNLDLQFATTEGIGFILAFIGLIGMFTSHNKKYTKVQSVGILALVPYILATATEYKSSLPFIAVMIIGAAGCMGVLIYISIRMKSVPSAVLFSVGIVAMIIMGYLSTKTKDSAPNGFEWAFAQISVNVIYQGCYLVGALILKKKGLAKEDSLSKTKIDNI
jgi:hypothetical protein